MHIKFDDNDKAMKVDQSAKPSGIKNNNQNKRKREEISKNGETRDEKKMGAKPTKNWENLQKQGKHQNNKSVPQTNSKNSHQKQHTQKTPIPEKQEYKPDPEILSRLSSEVSFPRGAPPPTTSTKEKKSSSTQQKMSAKIDEEDIFKTATLGVEEMDVDTQGSKFKKVMYKPGTAVLGSVRHIHDFYIQVALPRHSHGIISKDEVPAECVNLHSSFFVGQLLTCVVVEDKETAKNGQKSKIVLSVKPSTINKDLTLGKITRGMRLLGSIKSEEDRGYIIDFGLKDCSGFALSEDCENSIYKDSTLKTLIPGQIVECVVNKVKPEIKLVTVTLDKDKLVTAKVSQLSFTSIQDLQPGMMVKGTIVHNEDSTKKKKSNGKNQSADTLQVSLFDGAMEGSIFKSHMQDPSMTKGDMKIIFVDYSNNFIMLTARDHLIKMQPYQFTNLQLWQIIPDAIVKSILPVGVSVDINAVVAMKEGKKGTKMAKKMITTAGFIPRNALYDDDATPTEAKIAKDFVAGATLKCRIVGFSSLEGDVFLTCKPSIVNDTFLDLSKYEPGSFVEGTVTGFTNGGVALSIAPNVIGVCPRQYLEFQSSGSDTVQLAYPVGSKHKFRVLRKPVSSLHLSLINKKAIMADDLTVIKQNTDLAPGVISYGSVTSIMERKCVISFFNDVRGVATTQSFGKYRIGQVLQCLVKKTEGSNTISLEIISGKQERISYKAFKPGDVIEGADISKITDKAIFVRVQDKYQGIIFVNQISDHLENLQPLLQHFQKTKKLTGKLLILKVDHTQSSPLVLSMKKSLIEQASSLPRKFDDIEENTTYPGYISSTNDKTIFINTLDSVCFLIRKGKHKEVPPVQAGQSVRVHCVEVNKTTKRCSASLTHPSCFTPNSQYLLSYFDEREALSDLPEDAVIGKSIDVTVTEVQDEVVLVATRKATNNYKKKLDSDLLDPIAYWTGVIIKEQLEPGTKYQVGETIKARILDIDNGVCVFDLSAKKPHVEIGKKKANLLYSGLQDAIKSDKQLEATIEIVKPKYLVVSLPQIKNSPIAFVSTTSYNTAYEGSSKYKIGQTITVTPVPESTRLADKRRFILGTVNKGADRIKEAEPKSELQPGDIVSGRITRVDLVHQTCNVKLSSGHAGILYPTDVKDTYEENPLKTLKLESVHKFYIVELNSKKQYVLSLRRSLVAPQEHQSEACEPIIRTQQDLRNLKSVKGYMLPQSKQTDVGVVRISATWIIFVPIESAGLSDTSKFAEIYHPGKLVQVFMYLAHGSLRYSFSAGDAAVVQVKNELKGRTIHVSHVPHTLTEAELKEIFEQCGEVTRVMLAGDVELYTRFAFVEFAAASSVGKALELPAPARKVGKRTLIATRAKHAIPEVQPTAIVKPAVDKKLEKQLQVDMSDLKPGVMIVGTIRKILPGGLLVTLLYSKITGYVSCKEIYDDDKAENLDQLFQVGQKVRAVVKSVDLVNNKIAFTMKKSVFEDSETHELKKQKSFIEYKEGLQLRALGESKKDVPLEEMDISDSDSDDDSNHQEEEEEVEAMEIDQKATTTNKATKPPAIKEKPAVKPTIAQVGFDWDDDITYEKPIATKKKTEDEMDVGEEDLGELDEQQMDISQKKSRREKRIEKEKEEQAIMQRESELVDEERLPESSDDFERLLMASPNSSFVWIKYMAYQLSLTEIEKARGIAEKALKAISFREEQEKLNVWVAYLNLENTYGTKESLMAVFERAIQYNDPKKVYLQLVDILTRSDQLDLCDETFKTMCKKFKDSKKVWIKYAGFLLKKGSTTEAHKLLERALQSLPKRKHIQTICKFGQLEFKHGSPEYARFIFEGLVSNHPKKTDLWSVYLDMETAHGDVDVTRKLYERVVNLSLSTKKMKFFISRYLKFEKEHGTEETINHVKQKAKEYIDAKLQ